jgi:hypothetical protein
MPSRPYDVVVALSRSGTTTEVAHALMRSARSRTVAITAVPDSPVAHAADEVVELEFADEQSVVQTRFATTALSLLRAHEGLDLAGLVADAVIALDAPLPVEPGQADRWAFIGRGWTVGLASEAALKLRESAQAWTEAYPAFEYRHGPISIAGPGAVVWSFGPADDVLEDARAAGALTVAPDLDPLASLVLAQRTGVALAGGRRARPRPSAQPDPLRRPLGGAEVIRISFLAALAAAAVLAGCGGSSGDDQKAGGPVEITMWHGQDDIAGKVLGQLADDFNKTHKNIKVKATTGGVVADQMRQKVTTALASGEYPDIAYIFGSDLANLARSDKVLDLTDDVKKPDFGWDDYYAPAKAATTVNGRVRALPALIDDLAVVYNKKLFKEMGVSEPPAGGWTWDQFIATSKQLTDKGKGTFGTAWPAVGDEDTVWRTWPLVWQAGGDIIKDGKAAFGGAPGEQAFGVVDRLAQDGSVYVDTKPDSDQTYQLFNNGKIGMVVTGRGSCPTSSRRRSTSASRRCRPSAARR